MIYTSYFAKAKKLNDGYLVLGITRFPPSKLKENIAFIAPSEELLYKYKTGKVSEEEYEKIYLKEVGTNIDLFAQYLDVLGKDKHVVMCCYESSDKFCHRHILARELNKRGFNIKELK